MTTNDEDKIWITVSHTINTGNYESIKIETGFSRTITEGESPYDLIKRHTKRLIDQTTEQADEVRSSIKKLKRKHID